MQTFKAFSLLLISSFLLSSCIAQLPPHWDDAVLLKDLPKDSHTGASIINPWNYEQRLGSIKSLILETTKQSPCLFGQDVKLNPLWGLALQLGWQFDSGRLFSQTGFITSHSWWADMNYQLIIVPLLGASGAKYPNVPQNLDVLPSNETDWKTFCKESTLPPQTKACQYVNDALHDWTDFFKGFPLAEKNCTIYGRDDAVDHLLGNMWKAHTSSLKQGLLIPYVKDTLKNFSEMEEDFGVSWANLVEFIAATHFYTDFDYTTAQQVFLPPRMLTKSDHFPIKGMSLQTNFATFAIETAKKVNDISDGLILKVWKRAMCSKKGRADGRVLINEGLKNPTVFVPGFFKIVRDLSRKCDY